MGKSDLSEYRLNSAKMRMPLARVEIREALSTDGLILPHPIIEEIGRSILPRKRRYEDDKEALGEQTGYVRVRLPNTRGGEIFGIADQLLGASRIRVMCADGKSRMGRIPGKIKKRMWIREGDLLIIKPWDFQDEKADILYRYTKTQSSYLSRKRMIPQQINIF